MEEAWLDLPIRSRFTDEVKEAEFDAVLSAGAFEFEGAHRCSAILAPRASSPT